ncbi:hypothetical protein AHAS_Ahas12G0039000 [Arachis hypogaea]
MYIATELSTLAAAETKRGHCKMSLVDYSSSSDDDVALPLEQVVFIYHLIKFYLF